MKSITAEQIAQSGIVGAGGAGFPTHIKLSAKADTVVVNAAECEPLLHKDKELILHYPQQIVTGLAQAMALVEAGAGVIGIKGKYKHVIDAITPYLAPNMKVVPLDDCYPAGDEFILIWQTLGRVIAPGAIPLSVGAVVLNVETCYNLALADQTPVTHKFVSVAGAVKHPCTVYAPIGATLASCLDAAGGATIPNPAFVVGGAMMGALAPNLDSPVTKTTGGIIVLPSDHFIVERKSWDWARTSRVAKAACDQCMQCTERCPRYLLGHPIEPSRAMRSLGFNLSRQADSQGTQFCCECNLCSYSSCPESLDPKGVCSENKRRIFAEKSFWTSPTFDPERPKRLMKFRQTPNSQLMRRLGLSDYPNKGPLLEQSVEVNSVTILLKQHIGAPCVPTVSIGERVTAGQTIAVRPQTDGKPALGADIHASIAGSVVAIHNDSIVIEK